MFANGTKQVERVAQAGEMNALRDACFALDGETLSAWFKRATPTLTNAQRRNAFQRLLVVWDDAANMLQSGDKVLIDAAIHIMRHHTFAKFYRPACVRVAECADGSMSAVRGRHAPKVASRGIIGETETRRRLESDNAALIIFSGSYHVEKSIENDGKVAPFNADTTWTKGRTLNSIIDKR